MNTNPEAKVIICYGDSNTHGTRPDSDLRYPSDVRWTGQLQKKLGDEYYVIEEGLGGRGTNLEHPDLKKTHRNGLGYFIPCIQSHRPYDLIILALGTNDMKKMYNRSAKEVAEVLGQYCDISQEYCAEAQILLVSPAHIIMPEPTVYYDQLSAQKSQELAEEIEHIAKEKKVHFFDAAKAVSAGLDGIHWDIESHANFTESIEKIVKEIL